MSVRLFMGNLSYQVTEAEVREYFSAVGPLVFLHLPTDRDSGRPRRLSDGAWTSLVEEYRMFTCQSAPS
jgi:hypothetical protein